MAFRSDRGRRGPQQPPPQQRFSSSSSSTSAFGSSRSGDGVAGGEMQWAQLLIGTFRAPVADEQVSNFVFDFVASARRNGHRLAAQSERHIAVRNAVDVIASVDELIRGTRGRSSFDLLIVVNALGQDDDMRQQLIANFGKRVKIFIIRMDNLMATNRTASIARLTGNLERLNLCGPATANGPFDQAKNRGSLNYRRPSSSSGPTSENNERTHHTAAANPNGHEKPLHPIAHAVVEKICEDLDQHVLIVGSSELLRRVQGDALLRRLNDPWKQARKDGDLLRVVVAVGSGNSADVLALTNQFLMDVADSTFIKYIADSYVIPMMHNADQRSLKNTVVVTNLLNLFVILLERLPSKADKHMSEMLAVQTVLNSEIVCSSSIRAQLDEMYKRFLAHFTNRTQQKAELTTTAQAASRQRGFERRLQQAQQSPPPEDFRSLSICPVVGDLLLQGEPYLRANRISGRYDDSETYLDVQFRLLREDFVRPLRDGIRQYRQGDNVRKIDLFVYGNAKIGLPNLHKETGEMVCYVNFQVSRRKMQWMKRLKFGSLVCLSSDEFNLNFIFGVVFDRKVDDLTSGKVGILFETMNAVDHTRAYKMIESSAYFEAYRHVLQGLQGVLVEFCKLFQVFLQAIPAGELVPFSNYLVAMQTHCDLPQYIRIDGFIDYSVICADRAAKNRVVNVRYMQERVTADELGLDDSQFRALCMGMQQEFAVIQGPPGTGKTFLGHQIAKILLANERKWNGDARSPMLVVCYTNHALDQFLEGILDYLETMKKIENRPNLIRVGGRCKNPVLEQYVIHKAREQHGTGIPHDLRRRYYNVKKDRDACAMQIAQCDTVIKSLNEKLCKFATFKGVMNESHCAQFLARVKPNQGVEALFADWLTVVGEDAARRLPPEETEIPVAMDPDRIRYLMQIWNLPEAVAKNACYATRNGDENELMNWYFETVNRGNDRALYELMPQARDWPSMAAINRIVDQGFTDDDAVEVLAVTRGDLNAALDMLHTGFNFRRARDVVDDARNERTRDGEQHGRIEGNQEDLVDDVNHFVDEEEEEEEETHYVDADDRIQGYRATDIGLDDENWSEVKSERSQRLKAFTARILHTPPMDAATAAAAAGVDVFALPMRQRWALYASWMAELSRRETEKLRSLQTQFTLLVRQFKEIRLMGDVDLLRSARVIGMTTTGAAKHQAVLRAIQCRVVIMEEAAEVFEAHLVTSLTHGCQHAILIGDHQQLRPNPAVYKLAKDYHLDISLFERLINNKFPYASLENQHRMRPIIARTFMPHFYPNLRDDASVSNYENVLGLTTNMQFICHNEPEQVDAEMRSHRNEYEANYAVHLARYLLHQGYSTDRVTILCTYMDQMLHTRQQMKKLLAVDGPSVRVEVVDNYQGEECDIIILCLVRSTNPKDTIGFLKVSNRVCVALSRAKIGFYILGNLDFLAEKCDLWSNIRQSLKNVNAIDRNLSIKCQLHGEEQIIKHWHDFERKSPEGGCQQPCAGRLECGHVCEKPCHAYDIEHVKAMCGKACAKKCPAGHECKKRCYEVCGDCKVRVTKTLSCGHVNTKALCYQEPETIACLEKCKKMLPCGHACRELCSRPCTESCKQVVERVLPCGDQQTMPCYQNPALFPCQARKLKCWPLCDHQVEVACSVTVERTPCPHRCGIPLPGCEHICPGTCGGCAQGRLHIRCEQKCARVLICGHECTSGCASVCPPCEKACETECPHSRCGFGGSGGKKLRQGLTDAKKTKGKQHGRRCGEACPPCMEQCVNHCVHFRMEENQASQQDGASPDDEQAAAGDQQERKVPIVRVCDKKCCEPCIVEPCNEPCEEKCKQCGFPCIGLCGEQCPDVCPVCNPDKFAEITQYVFGHEDASDARFLQLPDCGHYVEYRDMDSWVKSQLDAENEEMDADDGEIEGRVEEMKNVVCPHCRTPVRRSRRYLARINQRIIDIETIKRQIFGGTKEELAIERDQTSEKLKKFRQLLDEDAVLHRHPPIARELKLAAGQLADWMSKLQTVHITKQAIVQWKNLSKILANLCQLYVEIIEPLNSHPPISPQLTRMIAVCRHFYRFGSIGQSVTNDWLKLVVFVRTNFTKLSDTMLQQLSGEILRVNLLAKVSAAFLEIAGRSGGDLTDQSRAIVDRILRALHSSETLTKEKQGAISADLEELRKLHPFSGLGISEVERMQILQAMGAQVTKWYKCSKGHYYGIGDCGQANQRGQCPECKEEIGGTQHRLVATSQEATEMSASPPARANILADNDGQHVLPMRYHVPPPAAVRVGLLDRIERQLFGL